MPAGDWRPGLEGVIAAETEMSDVDGARGELVIRGHRVEDLAHGASFEDACGLLWTGRLPSPDGRERVREALALGRGRAFERMGRLGDALDATDGMDALRASMGHLEATGDPEVDRASLTGAAAAFASAWVRRRAGLELVPPDASLSQAGDYLRMVTGEPPPAAYVRALDAYLCCVIDHGMNASTFAARVVASTASDPVSAVVAGIAALKGPLHGGAPGPVLDMLDAIGSPDAARSWLEAELASGRRIMGMGHRVYRVRDPRAAALEAAATELLASGEGGSRLELARAVERKAEALLAERHPDRPLRANVEFYTAVLLEAVGIPRTLFAPTFATSRIAGWIAHYDEQRRTGRLIRPSSTYVGPMPGGAEEAAVAV